MPVFCYQFNVEEDLKVRVQHHRDLTVGKLGLPLPMVPVVLHVCRRILKDKQKLVLKTTTFMTAPMLRILGTGFLADFVQHTQI